MDERCRKGSLVSQRLPWRVFANALARVFGCGCVALGTGLGRRWWWW